MVFPSESICGPPSGHLYIDILPPVGEKGNRPSQNQGKILPPAEPSAKNLVYTDK
jgi:hypothetical protein